MSIALNSLRNILFRSATVVFLLLTTILTARALGPEGRAVYTLVIVTSSISVTFFSGIGTAAGRWISNLRRPVPEVVANVTALSLSAGVIVLIGCLAVYWLGGLLGYGGDLWWLPVMGGAHPGLLLAAGLTWVFLGAGDHTQYRYAIIAPSLFTLLFLVPALIMFPGSTRAALVAWLLAQYAVVVWIWQRGLRSWSPVPFGRVSLDEMRALAGFSAMSGAANVVSLLNYRADTYLTGAFLGTARLGVYSVAVQLVEGLTFISQAVGVAILPGVGAATRDEAARLVIRSVRYTLWLMAAGGLLVFAAAGIAIPLLYGSDFAPAVAPFRWFVPGVVAWGAANLLATFYTNQTGRPRVPLAIAALSLVITVVLCLILIPMLGMSGGAIATTAGYTVAILVELWLFQRETGASWADLLLLNRGDVAEIGGIVATIRARIHTPSPASAAPLSGRRLPAVRADGFTERGGNTDHEPLFRRVH